MKTVLFWSATALLVFGEVMIVRAWWAGRTPAVSAVRPRAREFLWIVLPAIALAATLVATWRAQQPRASEAPAHGVHGEVTS